MLALALELDDFLLGQQLVAAVGGHVVQFLKALDRLLHGDPVGEQAAQPALVDVGHAAAVGFFGDGVLRLALGADEEDRACRVAVRSVTNFDASLNIFSVFCRSMM